MATLGPATQPSPLPPSRFVDRHSPVLVSPDLADLPERREDIPVFEVAGPRSRLFFDPSAISCGIVTCGGLCPGVNDVIRSVVMTLHYSYGVGRILGFRYGYAGIVPASGFEPMVLDPEAVTTIHEEGGTLLGSSRGPQDLGEMAENLQRLGISVLFAIGGDGTLRGASALDAELRRRGLPIGVVGVPKTIDDDLQWTERSFGFATAVEEARRAIAAAHAEARGAFNGVGLVKLMGRQSGFIAAHACLANSDVNLCLVPEVPFELEGEHGLLAALVRRLRARRHAVVVVAEGCGEQLEPPREEVLRDASGNLKLQDVGVFLRDRIGEHCRAVGEPVTVKYIDPSYTIRSLPANAMDSELCLVLGQNAVHAAMAGRTNLVVAGWNQRFVHVPIALAVAERRRIDPDGALWRSVLQATGQPSPLVDG